MTTGLWEILIPPTSEDRNECTNPSFETGTDGWTASGTNTISAGPAQQYRGVQGMLMTYQNNTTLATYAITFENQNTTYYLKAWVRVPTSWDGGNIRITTSSFTSATETNVKIYTDGTDLQAAWVELITTLAVGTDVTGSILISTNSAPTGGTITRLDAVYFGVLDIEYYDGDSDDAEWEGLAHASKSILPARTRSVGIATNLDSYNTFITGHSGTGFLPVNQRIQPIAFQIDAESQGYDVDPRVFNLNYEIIGTSLANLHQNKKSLIDAVKPDLSPNARPLVLRYLGAGTDKHIDIECFYEGGLEGGITQGFTEVGSMRFVASSPLWFSGRQAGEGLTTSASATFISLITQEGANFENPVSSGGTNVKVAKYDNQRRLWVGGSFTTINGTTVNRIAYLDPDTGTWTAIGGATKGVNNDVFDIDFLPNGDVVIVGDFTTAGGSSANRIVSWDGSSFNTYGTGLNGRGLAVLVHTNGDIYVAGYFTTANSVSCAQMAYWNGSTFDNMDGGATGFPATMAQDEAACLAERSDGLVFVGGNFDTAGTGGNSVTCNGVAAFDPVTNLWSFGVPGDYITHENTVGANSLSPTGLAFDSQGYLYIGGPFDQSTYASVADFDSLARVNPGMTVAASFGGGVSYTGSASAAQVNQIRQHPDTGKVWICGRFDEAGGSELPSGLAIWSGEIFTFPEFDFPGTTQVIDVTWDLLGQQERTTAAFTGSATITYAGTDAVVNPGTAISFPIITIKRTGGTEAALKRLGNATTGLQMLFDYLLANGETITIDTRPGHRSIQSDAYGNILGAALVPLSDFANFNLLPGTNNLIIYIAESGSPTLTVRIWFDLKYWSLDGTA